jgi:hypothetical protein
MCDRLVPPEAPARFFVKDLVSASPEDGLAKLRS